MSRIVCALSILFDAPFYIGLSEQNCDGVYEVCRIIFGAEPKDYEVFEFLLGNWTRLKFSPVVKSQAEISRQLNPKRMQRAVSRQLQQTSVSTKAQQALKLQQEQNKLERKTCSRAQREADEKRRYALRANKRREKHRGH